MINSLNSNHFNLNLQNKNLNHKENNLSKPSSENFTKELSQESLINSSNKLLNSLNDKTGAVDKILGYGVDKDGFFTSDFNEAAGLPKDYKIYAKGAENFVEYRTNTGVFTSIDLAKSINRAYQVFSQLVDEPNGSFTSQDIDEIPQYFQWNDKTLKLTKIYTKDEFINISYKEKELFNNLRNDLSFPSPSKLGLDFADKNSDIFEPSRAINIGEKNYKNDDGSISKGGVLMAFFVNSIGFLRGETTIAGKLAGLDDDFGASQRQELMDFMQKNPILYSSGDVGVDLIKELTLGDNVNDVEEFKKQWLEMKAKSDAMGDKYKAEIAEQKLVYTENDKTPDEKPFKAIQAESQNKNTYKDSNISNEFLKKLLENSFNKAKELELLLGIKINDDSEVNQILTQKNLQNKSVDIRV